MRNNRKVWRKNRTVLRQKLKVWSKNRTVIQDNLMVLVKTWRLCGATGRLLAKTVRLRLKTWRFFGKTIACSYCLWNVALTLFAPCAFEAGTTTLKKRRLSPRTTMALHSTRLKWGIVLLLKRTLRLRISLWKVYVPVAVCVLRAPVLLSPYPSLILASYATTDARGPDTALSLDQAIQASARQMSADLQGRTVAVVNFSSPASPFSEYVIDGLSSALANTRRFDHFAFMRYYYGRRTAE